MNTPPRVATALLKRLAPRNDALAGDLREAYLAGKSAWWYWRQVLTTIAMATIGSARTQPLQALRTVVIGAACVWLVAQFMSNVLAHVLGFDQWLFETGVSRWFYMNGYRLPLGVQGFPMLAIWKALTFAAFGYLAARAHARPAVILFALGVLAGNVFVFAEEYLTAHYSLAQLIGDLLILYPVASLAGGLLASWKQSATRAIPC